MVAAPHVVTRLRGTAADMLAHKGTVVHAIGSRETVYQAIARMMERRIGALLVMDDGALQGIITERDYARKVVLQGYASKDTAVAQIMTPAAQLLTVAPETTLDACLNIVNANGIRHLPVLRDGQVVGLLSIGDLVRSVVSQQAETIQSLSAFIGGDYPN